jgi:pentatricopeptide repeat protein
MLETMMQVYTSLGLYDKPEELWHEEIAAGRKPTKFMLISRVTAFGCLKQFDKAEGCLPDMAKYELSGIEICNSLLHIFIENDEYKRAEKVLQFIVESSMRFDVQTYSILMDMNRKLKNVEGVDFLLQQMREDGIAPDLFLCNRLIYIYLELQRPNKAVEVWKYIREAKIEPDIKSYLAMIRVFAALRQINQLEQAIEGLKRKGGLNKAAYKELVKAFFKVGHYKKSVECFVKVRGDKDELVPLMLEVYAKLDSRKHRELLNEALKIEGQARIETYKE